MMNYRLTIENDILLVDSMWDFHIDQRKSNVHRREDRLKFREFETLTKIYQTSRKFSFNSVFYHEWLPGPTYWQQVDNEQLVNLVRRFHSRSQIDLNVFILSNNVKALSLKAKVNSVYGTRIEILILFLPDSSYLHIGQVGK
jgi:hypothetical protein